MLSSLQQIQKSQVTDSTNNNTIMNTIKLFSAATDQYSSYVKLHNIDVKDSQNQDEINIQCTSNKTVNIVQEKSCITSITQNFDTLTMFVSYIEGTIKHYQQEEYSLQYVFIRQLKKHTACINSISLSNSKMYLLSASDDNTLRVWDVSNGTQLVSLNKENQEHKQYLFIECCCWNSEDSLFASGDSHGVAVVWAPPLSHFNTSNQFIPLCKFKPQYNIMDDNHTALYCLKFQENTFNLYASYQQSGKIRLWNISDDILVQASKTIKEGNNQVLSIINKPKRKTKEFKGQIAAFDLCGDLLIAGIDKNIMILNTSCFEMMTKTPTFAEVHEDVVQSVAISENGKYVASGSEDGTVALFNVETKKCIFHYNNNAGQSVILAVSFNE